MVKGVYNLSAPVLDLNGRAVAALTIPFLAKLNSTRTEHRQAREHLVEISRELTKKHWWNRVSGKLMNYGQSRWTPYLLLMPSFAFILDVILLPLLFSLYTPLTPYKLTRPKRPIDL